jgi:hypothetical protein
MSPGEPPPAEERSGAGSEDEPERFGPLLVRRLTKEDGRALILYERDDDREGSEG